MSAESTAPNIPTTNQIAGYKLEVKIGEGGMGVVYRANQISMNRPVALKVLPQGLAQDAKYVQRFLREAQSAAKLHHANIVTALEVGRSPEGYYFFAMEFIEGQSLGKRIQVNGPLSEKEGTEILLGIARGLAHAEKAGLVHRDVKPDNILIGQDGIPKLADFGLAKAPEDATITAAGTVLGTPDYISPEQAKGFEDLDTRSDIYSLGATYYHTLVGKPPFLGETAALVLSKHLTEPPPFAQEHNPRISAGASKVIQKMMAKNPGDRYQTNADLIEDLECIMEGKMPARAVPKVRTLRPAAVREKRPEAAAEPGPRQRHKSRSLLMPVVFVVSLAFVIGAAVFLAGRNNEETGPVTPSTSVNPQVIGKAPTTTKTISKGGQPVVTPTKDDDSFKQAADFRANNPKDYRGQIQQYEDVIKKYQSGPIADKARAAIKEIQMDWEVGAQIEFNRIKDEAEPAVSRWKFREAFASIDSFPEELRNEKWNGDLEELRKDYVAAAHRALRGVMADVHGLSKQGKLEEAKKALETAIEFDVPEISRQVQLEIEKIDKTLGTQPRMAPEATPEDAFQRLLTNVMPSLESRDYSKAKFLLDTAAREEKKQEGQQEIEGFRSDVEKLLRFWKMVEAGVGKLRPGEEIFVKGLKGKYVKYENGSVILEMAGPQGGPQIGKTLMEMKAAEVTLLARKALEEGDRDGQIALALFHLVDGEGDLAIARSELAKAKAKGIEVGRYETFANRVETEKAGDGEEGERRLGKGESSVPPLSANGEILSWLLLRSVVSYDGKPLPGDIQGRLELKTNFSKPQPDKSEPLAKGLIWRRVESAQGVIQFLGPIRSASYAMTYVYSPKAAKLVCLVGSDDGVRLSINGKVVHQKAVSRGLKQEPDRFEISLKKGMNRINAIFENGGGITGLHVAFKGLKEEDDILPQIRAGYPINRKDIREGSGDDDLRNRRFVSLTQQIPMQNQVGWGQFLVNMGGQNKNLIPIFETDCMEFLYAHAPSSLVYNVPPGTTHFTAYGASFASKSVKFRVVAMNKVLHESERLDKIEGEVTEIKVKLPREAKTVELVIDACGDNGYDQTVWAFPRFWQK